MNPVLEIDYLIFIFALLLVICGTLSWRSSESAPGKLRYLLVAFRICSIACLGAIAFNPGSWEQGEKTEKHGWAVLADFSGSMAVKDDGKESRWAKLVKLHNNAIKPQSGKIDIETFTFNDTLNAQTDKLPEEIIKDDAKTDINKSGEEVISRYKNMQKSLDGIIIFSDGHQVSPTTADEFIMAARAENIPVYAVPLGGKVFRKDLKLICGKRRYLGFTGQDLELPVSIQSSHLDNIRCKINLTDGKGKIIKTQRLDIPKNKTISTVFKIKMQKKGFYQYGISIPVQREEAITWNNSCNLGITVLDKKLNILFIEGQPFWDSKFLSQLFRNSDNINLTTVYRIASGSFFAISSGSNKIKEVDTDVFPSTLSGLQPYDIIIIGKGAEYFLDKNRTKALRKYISDNGGALLFSRGKPYSGKFPIMEKLETVEWGEFIDGDFKWHPTSDGVVSGLFGAMLPGPESTTWKKLPPVKRINDIRKLKTFSETLLVASASKYNRTKDIPALISRRFGKGIIVTINSEGIWQWDFFPATKDISVFYRNFWTQIIHWMVMFSEYLPGSTYSMRLSKTVVNPGSTLTAFISSRSAPDQNRKIKLTVYKDGKICSQIIPVKESGDEWKWSSRLSFNTPGAYLVELEYPGLNKQSGKLYEPVFVSYPVAEKDNLSADTELLSKLAKSTGGRILKPEELASIFTAKKVVDETAQNVKQVWSSWWANGLILCLVLTFFALECFFRRRNGLL